MTLLLIVKKFAMEMDGQNSETAVKDDPNSAECEESISSLVQAGNGCDIRLLGVERVATWVVDNTLEAAIQVVQVKTERPIVDLRKAPSIYANISWPTIAEFTLLLGFDKINEFVELWERNEEWLYCIDFLGEEEDICSCYFFYEVKWSIPTKSYPIPQATASVYFTIEVSKIKPIECLVEVSYRFECTRFIHIPGTIDFRETWLYDILRNKINFYKTITF